MENKNELTNILHEIANALNISETEYNTAVESYKAVGSWLEGEKGLKSIKISPQGSFNLGTVVKPFNKTEGSYDIDLVCNILDAKHWSNKKIKQSVGERLKENKLYFDKLEEEGKRCWTMEYAGFEMDILPATYENEKVGEIKLTHKLDSGKYEPRYSNPSGYRDWFIKKMIPVEDREFAEKRAEIEEVPLYAERTPLQKAVQLLKRHRDVMFENRKHAPISILITTLAARAYNNGNNLFEVLVEIVNYIDKYISKTDEDEYIIENPVMPEENFADKWNEEEEKAEMFFQWIAKVKEDILITPLKIKGIHLIKRHFSEIFGETITTEALNRYSKNMAKAREDGILYYKGPRKGIATESNNAITPVKDHTFYGR